MSESANAELVLGLQFDNGSTSKTVSSGSTVLIDLTLTDTDGTSLFASEGLFSGAGRLLQLSGSGVLMGLVPPPNDVTDVDGKWVDFFTGNPDSAPDPTEIGKALGGTFGPAAMGLPVSPLLPASRMIRIARFAYTVSGAALATTSIKADILRDGVQDIVTFDTFTELDSTITSFGGVDLTISGAAAVPEPASMALASLTLAVAGGGSYLRRRRANTADTSNV